MFLSLQIVRFETMIAHQNAMEDAVSKWMFDGEPPATPVIGPRNGKAMSSRGVKAPPAYLKALETHPIFDIWSERFEHFARAYGLWIGEQE